MYEITRIFISKNGWIDVDETANRVKELIESSKDGDVITFTKPDPESDGDPIYVMRSHIIYFLTAYLGQ